MMWSITTDDKEGYACSRLKERVLGNSAFCLVVCPLLSRRFRPGLEIFLARAQLPVLLAHQLLPRHPAVVASLGGSAGMLEDRHARLAWDDARRAGRAEEPELWTARTLVPAVAFVVHPFLALKALDGEMKGADSALADIEERAIQEWPFFAVLDPFRPSPEGSDARYKIAEGKQTDFTAFRHLLFCRLWLGFFDVIRHPNNAKWEIF
mmetsp:Transcript_15107/g.31068  ORF Transcript_15107/g.31068 Transcript_15107/m.31068 type:complete len:208 (-) Transcript_15107:207-830(-)